MADKVLVDHEDFAIREGERLALVGRNGTGKSTLMRVLVGAESFYTGEISRRRGLRCSYLAQEIALRDDATVRDNILDGAADILELVAHYESATSGSQEQLALEAQISLLDGWRLEGRAEMLGSAVDAPPSERIVATLSGGEKRRVALCRVLIGQPDLLVLDEPTNHLDTEAIEWLETFLGRYPGTVFFVTHDRHFLDQVATRMLELDNGGLHSYKGNYSAFLRGKGARQADLEANEARRLSFIRREMDWIQRGPKARGTKARGRIQRFDAAVNTEAIRREKDVDLVIPPASSTGKRVVDVEALTMELGGRVLIRDFSHSFQPGERVGVVGCNGLGKTTLLRLIQGELQPAAGRVRIGERTVFNYADQHRVLLDGSKTIFEEVGGGKDFVMLGTVKLTLWAYLKRFLFTDEEIHTRVDQLSGGERNRLTLAKILKRGGNFLILDEPTNDLDLATLRILEEALTNFGGCVLVVSHDRQFLDRVCTAILGFEGDGVVRYQPGDYSYYAAKLHARRAKEEASRKPVESKSAMARQARDNTSQVRKLKWKEERELERIEEDILVAEEEVSSIETLFSKPRFYEEHGEEIAELTAQLETGKQEVARLYDRWAELEAIQNGEVSEP